MGLGLVTCPSPCVEMVPARRGSSRDRVGGFALATSSPRRRVATDPEGGSAPEIRISSRVFHRRNLAQYHAKSSEGLAPKEDAIGETNIATCNPRLFVSEALKTGSGGSFG